jgi:hypothetical protein
MRVKYFAASLCGFVCVMFMSVNIFSIVTTDYCRIEEILDYDCITYENGLYVKQHYAVNWNRTGYIICGPFSVCKPKFCMFQPQINSTYVCEQINGTKYWIQNGSPTMFGIQTLFIFFAAICCLLYIVYILRQDF